MGLRSTLRLCAFLVELAMKSLARAGALTVPFNKASLVGKELAYIREALKRLHISGGGTFSARCQTLLAESLGARKVLLTTSCTDALEMCALLLDLKSGDEFIVPSFAFVTTANALALRGARPVFVDIRPDTLNLDENRVERAITRRTKAIVALHYAGVGCEMDALGTIAERHGVAIVEDNAHGLFARYRGRPLGTFGALATQSFHETKNFTCGEGGALIVNDAALEKRAEIIHQKGTDRSRFLRGEVDKYTWVDLGSSFLPSDLLAAFLLAQLEARQDVQAKRRSLWDRYHASLQDWCLANGVRRPAAPAHCEHTAHIYHLLLPTPAARTAFLEHLRRHGVLGTFHFLPLHASPMGRRFGGRKGQCPISEEVSERLVRLPIYSSMTLAEQDVVLSAATDFAC